jgi:formylglycine-generating enzyme
MKTGTSVLAAVLLYTGCMLACGSSAQTTVEPSPAGSSGQGAGTGGASGGAGGKGGTGEVGGSAGIGAAGGGNAGADTAGSAVAGAGIGGSAATAGSSSGECDTGRGGFGGAFYNPYEVWCDGRTPMIADKNAFPASKPPCTGMTPYCVVRPCDSTTEPLFCCKGATPVCESCPEGMVSTGEFCMDATEVRRRDYQAWLKTNPPSRWGWCSPPAQDEACMAKPDVCKTNCDDHPQVCVNACEATSYCFDHGWILCSAEHARAVCTHPYPYGDTYQSGACNDANSGIATTVPVGSLGSCAATTASAVVYDLSGNVAEWSGGPKAVTPDPLNIRGGSYLDAPASLTCEAETNADQSKALPTLGFRCCTPLL